MLKVLRLKSEEKERVKKAGVSRDARDGGWCGVKERVKKAGVPEDVGDEGMLSER